MVFEIYSSDILIKGKKAEKYLEIKTKYNFTFIDTYIIAAVLGFLNNKKGIEEIDSDQIVNIPRTVLNSRSEKIDTYAQIIYLYNEMDNDPDMAVRVAFDEKKEKNEKYKIRELFYEYSLGGIDIFYDMISNVDYDNQIQNLKKIVDEYFDKKSEEEASIEEVLNREGF